MMPPRLILPLLFGVVLAACTPAAPPPPQVAVWQGEQSGLLFMRVIAGAPLRDARLTTPDGRHVLAQRLTPPEPAPADNSWGRPSIGIGGSAGSGGGFGTGIGLSFPISGGGNRGGGLASQAEFALGPEELAVYRSRAADWILELRFDNGITSMPAPALRAP